MGEKHKKKFARWKSNLPEKTRWLVEAVEEKLIPEFEARGFVWSNNFFQREDETVVQPFTLPFIRRGEGFQDSLVINFEKHKSPRFGISFRRWTSVEMQQDQMWFPHYLTWKKSEKAQYKSFGLGALDLFADKSRCEAVVDQVIALLPQVDACMEQGAQGDNVSHTYRMK